MLGVVAVVCVWSSVRFGGFGVGLFGLVAVGLVDVVMLWADANSVIATGEVLGMFGVVLVYLDFTLVFLYGLVGLLGLGICLQ